MLDKVMYCRKHWPVKRRNQTQPRQFRTLVICLFFQTLWLRLKRLWQEPYFWDSEAPPPPHVDSSLSVYKRYKCATLSLPLVREYCTLIQVVRHVRCLVPLLLSYIVVMNSRHIPAINWYLRRLVIYLAQQQPCVLYQVPSPSLFTGYVLGSTLREDCY